MRSERARRTSQIETESARHDPLLERLRHPRFERRLWLLAATIGSPGVAAAIYLVWAGTYSSGVRWSVTILLLLLWSYLVAAVHSHVVYPLRVVANLLQALREGDYSLRARRARADDALGEVLIELNALGESLKAQRLGALEASALLRRVVAEIDVVILTFDSDDRLQLVNRAGERLLGAAASDLIGRSADVLGLGPCLEGDDAQTLDLELPGSRGRWALRRSIFRDEGRPHQLLVLTDLSRTLRQEERVAWQRLIRVLGHELNNSLAPVHSMASTLVGLLDRDPRAGDWESDLRRGLKLIADRSESLSRFVAAYGKLARLPQPRLAAVEVDELVRHVAAMETRMPIQIEGGPRATVRVDRGQIEQLLINLVRNATEAAMECDGAVSIGWNVSGSELEIRVDDSGPGLANTANLFVPFFTTKPEGSGIGLVLSRQIVEAHGGTLTLENRRKAHGCVVRLTVPVVE